MKALTTAAADLYGCSPIELRNPLKGHYDTQATQNQQAFLDLNMSLLKCIRSGSHYTYATWGTSLYSVWYNTRVNVDVLSTSFVHAYREPSTNAVAG